MNNLIVVTFDRLDDAREAMAKLRSVERAGQIEFEDTAVVERSADGKVHVKNEVSGATEKGAAVGGLIGLLLTFFFPVVGLVLGAAAGAAVGSAMKTGVDKGFIEDVERELSPGKSALFLVVRDAHTDALIGALRPFKGEVVQTTLDTDAEEELREALRV